MQILGPVPDLQIQSLGVREPAIFVLKTALKQCEWSDEPHSEEHRRWACSPGSPAGL